MATADEARSAKRRGRPKLYTAELDFMLTVAVDVVKSNAREGKAPRNITSDKAACRYIATHPDAAPFREELGLPERTTGDSLAVRLSESRRRIGLTRNPIKQKA